MNDENQRSNTQSASANVKIPKIVESAAFKLLDSVQVFENGIFVAQVIALAATISTLFTIDYIVYFAAIIACIANITGLIFRIIANQRNVLGHSLLRISMMTKAYQNGGIFDSTYIFSKIPVRMYHCANITVESNDPSGEYFFPTGETGLSRLRWMIQENAFFNTTLYGACANSVLKKVIITATVVMIFAFLVIPMIDGDTELTILRVVLLLLSFTIVYGQIERWFSWTNACRRMKDIENELARFKAVPDHRVILLFSNYQVTISESPVIKKNIYQKNRPKLNAAWKQRVTILKQE